MLSANQFELKWNLLVNPDPEAASADDTPTFPCLAPRFRLIFSLAQEDEHAGGMDDIDDE
jgi:hypothetical protein